MNKNLVITLILIVLIILAVVTTMYINDNEKNSQGQANETAEQKNVEMLRTPGGLEVSGSEVTYYDDIKGWYAAPVQAGNYPGIVMIHEWWGLNNNMKLMAEELARSGYKVLAVDLYEGQVATDQETAQRLVSEMNQAESLSNMKAAVDYLKSQGATKVASLGWCFGGGQSLQLSLSDEKLDATALYYGQLVTATSTLQRVDAPVLGIFGDQDTSIPVESVRAFESALNANGLKNEIYIYEGVGHAFANPSGMNYAPEQTKDAWNKTLSFLERNLKATSTAAN